MNNFSISDGMKGKNHFILEGEPTWILIQPNVHFLFLIILVGKCKKVYPSDIGNKVLKKKKCILKTFSSSNNNKKETWQVLVFHKKK